MIMNKKRKRFYTVKPSERFTSITILSFRSCAFCHIFWISIYMHWFNAEDSSLWKIKATFIPDSRPTPPPMPTNFYGLVGYDRVKNYLLWLKSVSIPDQHPLYPRCTPDTPTLKSRSYRPTPVLPADQSSLCTTNPKPNPDITTLTTLNIGPCQICMICMLDFHSRPQMNNSST